VQRGENETPLTLRAHARALGLLPRSFAARGAFREGRLPEAARTLRALEAESAAFPPAERARYALYRGLTQLGLGDAALAERFLTEAAALEARHPGSLARAELGALDAARRSMGLTPAAPAPAAPLTADD
jgi:hypothetical protein